MPKWRYEEVGGRVKRVLIAERPCLSGEPRPDRHMSETLLKAYYQLECEQKFRSCYPKSVIKRAHETAIQRYEQTGVEA